jgi:hypothetical protein
VSTGTQAPLAVTISPATVLVAVGQRSFTEHVTVINSGKAPEHILATVRIMNAAGQSCGTVGASPSWASVSPASAVLAPGAREVATFHAAAPAGLAGHQDVAAIFGASPASANPGTATVSGAVASQAVLRLSGTTTTARCITVHEPATHPVAAGHSPSDPLGGGLVLVAVAVGLTLLAQRVTRRLRRRRARPEEVVS